MAETWLLLPFIYAKKSNGILTDYSHFNANKGLSDLINSLPGKENEYNQYLHDFFINLYSSLAENNQYFVEKTPRYYLIIPEILKLFPDAKFIFIFRNPVQIYASRMATYGSNRFSIFSANRSYFDLINGPDILTRGYELLKDKAYKLNYEHFISDPEPFIKDICNYLEIEYYENILSNFDPGKLAGRHMDKNAIEYGNKIVNTTVEKWKTVFNTSYRKKVLSSYISNLDKDTLQKMGYSKEAILKDIKNVKSNGRRNLIKDVYDFNLMRLKNKFNRISYN